MNRNLSPAFEILSGLTKNSLPNLQLPLAFIDPALELDCYTHCVLNCALVVTTYQAPTLPLEILSPQSSLSRLC